MTRISFNMRRWASWLGLALVIALMALCIMWLGDWIQRDQVYPFDSDEGLHAFDALRVSAYLRDGDLLGALDASLRQSFYPPVHAWLLSIVLSFVSATRANARLFSLVLYTLDVWLLYALGRWLARGTRFPWLSGLIASLLALAAPPMWVTGSVVYLEMTGVLFVLITFWGCWQGLTAISEGKSKWGWLVAGLGIVAAALTKYPYWLFLIAPLVLAIVAQAWPFPKGQPSSGWRALIERLTLLTLPSVVIMSAWVASPVTRSGLVDYITTTQDLAQRAQPSFLAHLVFYLTSAWRQFSPSPLVAVGLAVTFLFSLVRWRDSVLWFLAIFFAWHVVGISTHGGLAPRFLITAMPALWLMGGAWTARLAGAWPQWIMRLGPRLRWAAQMAMGATFVVLAVTSIMELAWRVTLYPTLYMLSLETDPRAEALYRWTAEQLPAGPSRIGLINDWDQMSGSALGWELTTRRVPNGTPRRADLVSVWEMHRLPEPTTENIDALREQMNARGLNTIVAYTAPGVGIKRLQGMVALLGQNIRLMNERDFPLRWYWPDKIDQRLYMGESLDKEQLQAAIDQIGSDRSLTVHVYSYTP